MTNLETIQKECKYGIPAADQILFNRFYTVGYSYFLRQPKWTMQIIDPDVVDEFPDKHVERADNFRPDYRIPTMFRADLIDFKGSGYDRGHLVASADQRDIEVQNSETFLLTNMAPQVPGLNRYIWRDLEAKVRELDMQDNVYETYVVSGPIIYLGEKTKFIGINVNEEHDNHKNVDVTIPVPHAFFKSIMIENNRGRFYMWNFIIKNEKQVDPLEKFQVTTKKVELLAGITLWDNLKGDYIDDEKSRIRKMW